MTDVKNIVKTPIVDLLNRLKTEIKFAYDNELDLDSNFTQGTTGICISVREAEIFAKLLEKLLEEW